jgi:3-hydroxybutyryl-CoA dehydrogenase
MRMDIHTIAVIGAGQMGGGIAQVAAQSGLKVFMSDMDMASAEKGKAAIGKRLDRALEKGKIESGLRDTAMENLVPVAGLKDVADAQLVIEAVSENENLKAKIFSELDKVTGPDTILASNTSSISITRIGKTTERADKVIGMHFMNPVPVMKLVEVIRGVATSDETYVTTKTMAEKFGKTVVTSQDYAGFIVNRVLMPMINEAGFALMEGVATAEDIDAAMKLGTNQPMGPLTLADFIGLDTCLAILEVMFEDFGDPKYRPCPLLKRMVDSGRHGRKSGQGFHKYD